MALLDAGDLSLRRIEHAGRGPGVKNYAQHMFKRMVLTATCSAGLDATALSHDSLALTLSHMRMHEAQAA